MRKKVEVASLPFFTSWSAAAAVIAGCWLLAAGGWLLLAAAGSCWLLLAAAGSCWLLLPSAGCCWLLLIAAGYCWLLLLAAAGRRTGFDLRPDVFYMHLALSVVVLATEAVAAQR